uniref:U1-C C2H2-type zinc finger domain-containing protein n=1 Tax=Oncorhynchus tshawytscha TaxID=74940 RepID=A0AAZ3QAA9_ONCTS
MGKRYYCDYCDWNYWDYWDYCDCDYCDRPFQDNMHNRKKHLYGVQHHRSKKKKPGLTISEVRNVISQEFQSDIVGSSV